MLPDMDKSIGHPLVHYLYTGTYQTLDDLNCSLAEQIHSEFKRAVLAYATAKKYELHGLEELAKDKIEHFGADMNIHDVVETIKDEYSKLPGNSTWFLDFLKEKARAAFEVDHTVFTKVDFFGRIDDAALTKVLAKCVMELYEEKVTRMLDAGNQPAPEVPGDCMSEVQESSFDAAMTEECVLVEDTPTSADEQSLLEAPAEESLIEEPSELLVEEPTEVLIEEPLDEEFPTEDFPVQDILVEEPVTAEPQLDPSAANSIAEAEKEDNGWGFSFGSTAKKSKKKGKKITTGTLWDEPVVIEAPQPPQAVLPMYDAFGGIIVSTTENVELAFEMEVPPSPWPKPEPGLEPETVTEPEPVPEPPKEEPVVVSVKDKKKKKKNVKAAKPEPEPEPIKEPEPVPEIEPTQEPELVLEIEPEKTEDDPWDSALFSSMLNSKKKKGKKGAVVEAVPLEPEPIPELESVQEPEPVLEIESEKPKDDPWGYLGSTASKKKKKVKKAAPVEDIPLEPEPVPELESVQEPEPILEIEPEVKEDDTWGNLEATSGKKKKKGKKGAIVESVPLEPEPIPEAHPLLDPEPIQVKFPLCRMCASLCLDEGQWMTCDACRAVMRQVVTHELNNDA
jgi:hypothetical protein